ncbi:uncharacterized protein LOC124950235 isoform X2 [Vespa velutina]|uniref:uncharacterized protein LOC124950235 isoform X2 n=1 Tax=Vespa velutina TaxID=202808 RepID=UPI001FB23F22|nr:uncharacterized protein LOC124950235 isoform X2 [Vespa velutina]
MMSTIDTIMSDFYNVLFKLRYPEITKAEPNNISSIIFSGDNRIHLLSWLLTEKVPNIANDLEKLEGSALHDKLAMYYSQLGICINKDILLDSIDVPTNEEESIANLLKIHFTEDTNNPSNTSIKQSYSEAVKYFEDLQKLDDSNESNNISTIKNSSVDSENNVEQNNIKQQKNFIVQIEKFMDTYNMISSWPVSHTRNENTIENNMDSNIKSIHSNFMIFKQMLHMKDEISKLKLPSASQKINYNRSLNSLVEDIMISTDETIDTL